MKWFLLGMLVMALMDHTGFMDGTYLIELIQSIIVAIANWVGSL